MFGDLQEDLFQALLAIDRSQIDKIVALARDYDSIAAIIDQLIVPVLERVGKGWEEGQLALSQVYMSGILCEEFVDHLLPEGQEQTAARKSYPKIALATLEDHHILGKKIIHSFVQAAGYELHDFGHGLNVSELVEKTLNTKPDVLLISTLMLTSALKIKDLTTQLNQQDSKVKVIVGGAPFVQDRHLWLEVGAYAMGKSASDSLKLIRQVEKEAM